MSVRPETGRARRNADRLLPQTWDLTMAATDEVVVDVESLIRGALGAEGWPCFLEPADERDLIATLLGDAVMLEEHYEARAGIEARPWLFQRLRWKAQDWRRVKNRHPVLDELAGDGFDPDDDEAGDRRSGAGDGSHGAPGEVAGDRGDPGVDALRRLLEGGDRALLREVAALGLSAPPGARGRTAQACQVLGRLDRARCKRVAAVEAAAELVAA